MLLSTLGRPGLRTLVDHVRNRTYGSLAIDAALARVGRPAEVALRPLLNHERDSVRSRACRILLGMGSPHAVAYMERRDRYGLRLRLRDARARFRDVNDPGRVRRLLAVLGSEQAGREELHRAAVTLGWLGDPRALEPLRALAGDARIISPPTATSAGRPSACRRMGTDLCRRRRNSARPRQDPRPGRCST